MARRLLNWLNGGCGHRRYSWPIGRGRMKQVICSDCGVALAYDWQEMRVAVMVDEGFKKRGAGQ